MVRAASIYLIDGLIAGVSLAAAISLRVGSLRAGEVLEEHRATLPLFVAVALVTFAAMRLHRRVWRYSSTDEIFEIIKAASIAVFSYVALLIVIGGAGWLPRSIPVIQWLVLVVLMGGARMARRLAAEYLGGRFHPPASAASPESMKRPALLFGSSDDIEQLLRQLEREPDAAFRAVGILDEAGAHTGARVRGVPVMGRPADLSRVVGSLAARDERPACLIFAGPVERLQRMAMVDIIAQAQSLELEIAYRPGFIGFAPEPGASLDFRFLNVADLLGRPQAPLDGRIVAGMISGRRILVTGAGGTIGRELVRQIAEFEPAQLVLLDANEFNLYDVDLELRESHPQVARTPVLCSIRQRRQVMQVFADHRPELVFHAAALKHVPLVEMHPLAGVQTNVLGTRNVADAARRYGVRAMVQVSTDKAVNPVGFMGVTKRLGELYCQALDMASRGDPDAPRFITVRFGNVLGSSGSLIPLFQRQLSRGGPLTVTHPEIERFFMTVHEAVQLILQSASRGLRDGMHHGRIFVLDMGDPIRVIDIARRMIRLAGLDPELDVGIDIIGLRPGEKLYEELFDVEEERLPSSIPGVFEAEPRPIPLRTLNEAFDALERASDEADDRACVVIATGLLDRKEALLAEVAAIPASRTRIAAHG
ncbi:polysaccharide biosynthesis protein [Sphingomonas sp. BT-65]|uniref:polysaccharide biosynthesis protein n=1 Tax=Sphingomonas sp. BT-65 TaxID=2989821 RepID=UPI002235C351|nr:nucleoside-diphosphate sugar epimerase/dehydratase [Sphingomonas sp. BT-65]MCW4463443.1 polysaccharide biosynthesis protein [Sphingomonas sp. BT-65]